MRLDNSHKTEIMKCSKVSGWGGSGVLIIGAGVTACMNMQSCTFQFILKPLTVCIHRIEYLNKYKKKCMRKTKIHDSNRSQNEVYKATKDRKSACPLLLQKKKR